MLKCNTYLKRDTGRPIERLLPCDESGLFPGQCRPPIDHTDVDPEEELFKLEQELDVPFKDRFYNVPNETPPKACIMADTPGGGEYVSAEPECDT
jgi:hypothetical protein